jgi:ATP-dependent DNA ligase
MLPTSAARVLQRPPLGRGHEFKWLAAGRVGGVVSKHRERAYRAGASPNWIKVKNPKHPAMTRVMKAYR